MLPNDGDLAKFSQEYNNAVMHHCYWMRTQKEMVSAQIIKSI